MIWGEAGGIFPKVKMFIFSVRYLSEMMIVLSLNVLTYMRVRDSHNEGEEHKEFM